MEYGYSLEVQPSGTVIGGFGVSVPTQIPSNYYLNIIGGFPANKSTYIEADSISQEEEEVYINLSNLPADMAPTDEIWFKAEHFGTAISDDPAIIFKIYVGVELRHQQRFAVYKTDKIVYYKFMGITPMITREEFVSGDFRITRQTVKKNIFDVFPIEE